MVAKNKRHAFPLLFFFTKGPTQHAERREQADRSGEAREPIDSPGGVQEDVLRCEVPNEPYQELQSLRHRIALIEAADARSQLPLVIGVWR